MEQSTVNFVHTEVSEPKHRFVRSNAALYVLLLACVLAIILLGNKLALWLNIPRGTIQLILYGILFVLAFLIYRFRLTAFRYTLTDCDLFIGKITGKKEANLFVLPLDKISFVGDCSPDTHAERTYCGRRENTIKVTCDGRDYLLSATDTLKEKLIEHTRTVDK